MDVDEKGSLDTQGREVSRNVETLLTRLAAGLAT
jgi:hypothetical protein